MNLKLWLVSAAAVLCSASFAAANLLPDPGFEEQKHGWGWASPKMSEVTNLDFYAGKYSLRLFTDQKSSSPVSQLFSREIPLDVSDATACKLRISFWYKGDAPSVAMLFLKEENDKFVAIQDDLGKPLECSFLPKKAEGWTLFEKDIPVSRRYLKDAPFVRLRFQRWAGKKPTETFLDDVSLEVIEGTPATPAKKKVAGK